MQVCAQMETIPNAHNFALTSKVNWVYEHLQTPDHAVKPTESMQPLAIWAKLQEGGMILLLCVQPQFAGNRQPLSTQPGNRVSPLGHLCDLGFSFKGNHMNRVMTMYEINAFGLHVAKIAMGSLVFICLGIFMRYAGAPPIGKWVTLTGTMGLVCSIWCFRYLLNMQDRVIQNFVLTYRHGDRLMGFVQWST